MIPSTNAIFAIVLQELTKRAKPDNQVGHLAFPIVVRTVVELDRRKTSLSQAQQPVLS